MNNNVLLCNKIHERFRLSKMRKRDLEIICSLNNITPKEYLKLKGYESFNKYVEETDKENDFLRNERRKEIK